MNKIYLHQPVKSFPSARLSSSHANHHRSRFLCTSGDLSTDNDNGSSKRGVVLLPGLGNSQADYKDFSAQLSSRGFAVQTAAVNRVDWLRNALGLRDINYWRGTLQPRPTVDWYMERVAAAVEAAKEETGGAPITLLAHSAGGWLARVYLLGYGTEGIDRLITLGSPHNPPPKGAAGVIDQTRGILTAVSESCPGNFHEEIAYVTIAGKYLQGARLGDNTAPWKRRVVGAGYQQVCGDPEAWGDGVVPLPAALLEGAEQVTLEGVYHSPLGVREENGEKKARPWYGSPGVLEQWVHHIDGEAPAIMTVEEIVKESMVP